ncbi:peptidylprolyl isomerase [Thalassotalea piscium]
MLSNVTHASIVEFQTSHGSFKINLHDKTTPLTVDNFLRYLTSERYNNTIMHRSEKSFVLQGGGFSFDDQLPLNEIEIFPAVSNEPVYSNVRGTIAMAKQENKPNSATSQWFINLTNNSNNLDVQNAGFTVFGEVIEDGMKVIDSIANLPLCNNVPIGQNYTLNNVPVTDNADSICENPDATNFVTIYQINIIDDADNTDADLNSVKNTLINQSPTTEPKSDSSGGSMFWLVLLLVTISLRQRAR